MNFKSLRKFPTVVAFICFLSPTVSKAAETTQWQVPLGGNAYLTEPTDNSSDEIQPNGITSWQSDDSIFSIFFRVDRPAILDLSLRMKATSAKSTILATVEGKTFEIVSDSAEFQNQEIGTLAVNELGYIRVDLQGITKSGETFPQITDLFVTSKTEGLTVNYVKDNQNNRFYWGRRGPSVHLQYQMPAESDFEYFYNEVTIPEGRDPIGTYAMANGFSEGYFGMQVNGKQERRILFSVWSPFHTDDPKSIPEDQRIHLLAKGNNVHTGEFGNEGSGGQSFLIYPWKTDTTYRFLNRAYPVGDGNTIYTAWFQAPEQQKWQLIASFRRPETHKYLTRFHSFLENFRDTKGHLERGAYFRNQWLRDTDGKWHPVSTAKLTGDDIATRKYRQDFAGGTVHGSFFLRNGGFFENPVALGTDFDRPKGAEKPPEINFETLTQPN